MRLEILWPFFRRGNSHVHLRVMDPLTSCSRYASFALTEKIAIDQASLLYNSNSCSTAWHAVRLPAAETASSGVKESLTPGIEAPAG